MIPASPAYKIFLQQVETAERAYPNAIAEIAKRIANDRDAEEALDDQIADLRDRISSRAANGVPDGVAEDVLELISRQFTDAISNAPTERRVAAMLTCVLPHQVAA
jgi:uncharacterized membrane protein